MTTELTSTLKYFDIDQIRGKEEPSLGFDIIDLKIKARGKLCPKHLI